MFEKEAEERARELEEEYYANRPTEPYSEEDSPSSWANIAYYAEENLDKAFKLISELKNENAKLQEKLEILKKVCIENIDCKDCKALK